MYEVLVLLSSFDFYHDKFISKNCENIFFYQKIVYLGENTSTYCSRIIVFHVLQMCFSKVHPACHNIASGMKPRLNSKTTDKHDADCSKAVCWGVM